MKKKTCEGCNALCCRYITVQLDEPTTKRDWDELMWYLCHKNIWVFIDHEDDWILEVKTDCEFLDENSLCTNYVNRPKVCRDHKTKDCEHHQENSPYQKLFKTTQDLMEYLEENNIDYQYKKLSP